jgi:serine/threonine protein kinase/tetratricopeptide (TPR) repeat protein
MNLAPVSVAPWAAPADGSTVCNRAVGQSLPAEINVEPPPAPSDLGLADSGLVAGVREALRHLPAIGDWFAGFHLVAVLGRGAFGRVYLARQGDLADRFVALKVSTDLAGESRTLARLQHTNIVPIYSVHRKAPFQAVCMPYFGATTLAHLLGRYRGDRSLPVTGRQLVDTLRVLNDRTEVPTASKTGNGPEWTAPGTGAGAVIARESGDEAGALPARHVARGFLGLLGSMTYTNAVCWMGAQLADGLAHAHGEGLVHNDLKPANVLLADDGRPMLLDFGVAEELATRPLAPAAMIGGTLPYMSPEHLESVRTGTPLTDARSDLYALGIILFEMLTGRHPFMIPEGRPDEVVPLMLAERRAGAPRLRQHNPAISPGLEAIVRKCLAPDPAGRYASAADLRDDLDRHRRDQPLAHVWVPSVRERAAKWARRHPRLTSNASLATLAAVVVGLCSICIYARGARLERYEALAAARGLNDDLQTARYELTAHPADPRAVGSGVEKCEEALARYGLPADERWDHRPAFRALPTDEQRRVRDQLTEACVFLARGYALQARTAKDEAQQLGRATEVTSLAERVAGDDVPRAVWEQRAGLLRRLGDRDGADRAAALGQAAPLRTGRDYYLSGSQALADGRYKQASELLAKAAEFDPADYWTHMALGAAYEGLGKYSAAAGCYDTAIALRPDGPWGHYNRGSVALRLWDYEKARATLDRAAELSPNHADTYLNRAVAAQGLRDYPAALKDLDRAAEVGAPAARVAFMRARIQEAAGDKVAAKQELAEAMKLEPTDELTWQTRGAARLGTDLDGALKDFEAGLAINPRSLAGLQNRAHVLSKLGRTEEAIRTLDQLLELYPDFVPARAGRGVLFARTEKWDAAAADAVEALRRDRSPANVYQVAGIYALLSKRKPELRDEAIRLLTTALRGGFGFQYIETDKELEPLRETPEFRRLIDGVHALADRTVGG